MKYMNNVVVSMLYGFGILASSGTIRITAAKGQEILLIVSMISSIRHLVPPTSQRCVCEIGWIPSFMSTYQSEIAA